MSRITKKLSAFTFAAPALVLASAPWKNNVGALYGFTADGTGYTVFKPGNRFNSLAQLEDTGSYILDAATVGFELPGVLVPGSAPAPDPAPTPSGPDPTSGPVRLSAPAQMKAGVLLGAVEGVTFEFEAQGLLANDYRTMILAVYQEEPLAAKVVFSASYMGQPFTINVPYGPPQTSVFTDGFVFMEA